MEEKTISYFEHEAEMFRMERTNHRLFIACLALVILNIVTMLIRII